MAAYNPHTCPPTPGWRVESVGGCAEDLESTRTPYGHTKGCVVGQNVAEACQGPRLYDNPLGRSRLSNPDNNSRGRVAIRVKQRGGPNVHTTTTGGQA
eukprot:8208761-Heterocapsa_arctica.AAC.1